MAVLSSGCTQYVWISLCDVNSCWFAKPRSLHSLEFANWGCSTKTNSYFCIRWDNPTKTHVYSLFTTDRVSGSKAQYWILFRPLMDPLFPLFILVRVKSMGRFSDLMQFAPLVVFARGAQVHLFHFFSELAHFFKCSSCSIKCPSHPLKSVPLSFSPLMLERPWLPNFYILDPLSPQNPRAAPPWGWMSHQDTREF